jgi:hypothetical protein
MGWLSSGAFWARTVVARSMSSRPMNADASRWGRVSAALIWRAAWSKKYFRGTSVVMTVHH